MNLIPHPKVEKLKEELSELILEYEDLNNHICPYIEHKYVMEFGIYEYELYKLELDISKLERKLQLIRIEINHQNDVDLEKIEETLSEEFEEYEAKVKAQIDEIESLKKNGIKTLSEEDAKEVKRIYRKIIKKLHPDLNPNQSFYEKNLFLSATDAFKSGSLDELQVIYLSIDEGMLNRTSEIENHEKMIKDFKDKIEKIKQDYPYNKKDLIADSKKTQEYKNMLLDLIEDRKSIIKKLEKLINDLI